jgi:hypothetical protein
MLAVILGDAIHNMRSALDHLAVAIAPRSRQGSTYFPIVLEDIEAAGPLTRDVAAARERFDKSTLGMPEGAIQLIRQYQPYRAATELERRTNALAILNRLDNADKHKAVTVLVSGFTNVVTVVHARGYELPQAHETGRLLATGGELAHFRDMQPPLRETEVRVTTEGVSVISADIGLPAGAIDIADVVTIHGYLFDTIIPGLEAFARQ